MLAHSSPSRQVSHRARRVLGKSPFVPLPHDTMREVFAHSTSRGAARNVLATLIMHADCMGIVRGYIWEVAERSGVEFATARHVLQQLRLMGEIESVQPGSGYRASVWHIAAIRKAA